MADDAESGVSTALQSVARGAGARVISLSAVRILGFVTTFLLTHSLGASLYGIYSFGKTLNSIAAEITNLGTDQSIVRFLPHYEGERTAQNRVVGLATLTSFVGGLVVGAILYFAAPVITEYTLKQPLLVPVLRLFAATLVFITLTGCISNVFRALELPGYQVISGSIARQVFRLITVGTIVVIGATLIGVLVAVVVAWILAFIFGVWLLLSRLDLRPSLEGSRPSLSRFYSYSVPLTLGDVGVLIQKQVDVLMIGIFLPSSAVGIYNLSLVLSQAIGIPGTATNTLYPAIASRMYSAGEHEDLQSVYKRVTRWAFTAALLIGVGLLSLSSTALSVFGKGFSSGAEVLSLLCIAVLVNLASGPTGITLNMTDHQYLTMLNQWGAGIANVVLNYLFIPRFGLSGAAYATVIVMAVVTTARISELWYTERLFPFSLQYLKPITAGLVCGAVLEGLKVFSPLSGFILLIVGAITGSAVYILSLLALGVEPEDREFLSDIVSRAS